MRHRHNCSRVRRLGTRMKRAWNSTLRLHQQFAGVRHRLHSHSNFSLINFSLLISTLTRFGNACAWVMLKFLTSATHLASASLISGYTCTSIKVNWSYQIMTFCAVKSCRGIMCVHGMHTWASAALPHWSLNHFIGHACTLTSRSVFLNATLAKS